MAHETDGVIEFHVVTTPKFEARHAFYAEHNVEPSRTVAQRIAAEYGIDANHHIVDDISHAIEDAWNLGEKLGQALMSDDILKRA